MVVNISIMAHCDAGNKGEETISSTYMLSLWEREFTLSSIAPW
jgi:hypothetical protein